MKTFLRNVIVLALIWIVFPNTVLVLVVAYGTFPFKIVRKGYLTLVAANMAVVAF